MLAASGIQAFHRSGQTFVTWNEDTAVSGEGYNIYRHSSPITTANISQAVKLTTKWGPLDDQTSYHQLHGVNTPANFVLQNLGAPLGNDQGLFVHTTQSGNSGTWYYAVTQVVNGVETSVLTSGVNTLATGVSEVVASPVPVLVYSASGGKSRVYTQFMDYQNWNPTFQGYAYNYSVALPYNYTESVDWPMKLMPHAFGERYRVEPEAEYQWQAIEVFPDDPGGSVGTVSSWWYGFAADHNYKTSGPIPTSGRVENFTEQRVLRMVSELQSIFSVDPLRIHAQGNSMGASGALTWGMRYGNVLAGTFSSEPMTNYAASPGFQEVFQQLWGTQASNLSVVNNGAQAAHLKQYDGIGVYDWMNHQEQIASRRGDDMAFLMFGHGKLDDVIDWATQGRPFVAAVNAANVGFTAEMRGGWEHNWMGFDFVNEPMFSTQDGGLSDWHYLSNVSFPGLVNATQSGPSVPGNTGIDFYNRAIDWSVPWNSFHTAIVDTPGRYEISLRSRNGLQFADVTPRNTQAYVAVPGTQVQWQNLDNATGTVVGSGTVVADANGLVTIPQFRIGTDVGNRLILINQFPAPQVLGPAATTTSQTPTINWTAVENAASYDVWVTNLSTNTNPLYNVNVAGTSWSPASSIGIGRYRVWVRARSGSGVASGWSVPLTFQVNTPATMADLPAAFETARPVFSWNSLPGAVKYDLWVDNSTTGASQVIRQTALTTTSFQPTADLAIGSYIAWVRGIDAAGNFGLWSPSESFRVSTKAIPLTPLAPTFDSTPDFSWQTVVGATSYEVYVSNRSTAQMVLNPTGITQTQWTPAVSMAVGDYRWWVRARGQSGTPGVWSSPYEFNISGKPVILSPGGSTSDRTPEIRWTPVAGAARYELWVSRLDGGGVVINETLLTNTSFSPASNLVPRAYRAWVRAVSSTGVFSPWSVPADITVVDSALEPYLAPHVDPAQHQPANKLPIAAEQPSADEMLDKIMSQSEFLYAEIPANPVTLATPVNLVNTKS